MEATKKERRIRAKDNIERSTLNIQRSTGEESRRTCDLL
jgi:hypothetical protein